MSKYKKLYKNTIGDTFIRTSFLLFAVSMMGNIIHYLFQITMGRLLTVEEYGEMNSLLAIFAVLTLIYLPVTNYFSNASAKLYAKNEKSKIFGLFKYSYRYFFLGLLIITVIASSLSELIGSFANIPTYKVLLIFLLGILSIITTINTGFLQGIHHFYGLSIVIFLAALLKYVFGTFFAYEGFSVTGVISGVILCTVIIAAISSFLMKRYFNNTEIENYSLKKSSIKKYLIPMFLINFLFASMTQIDIILVKHYFSAFETGIYSSAAVIGKAVLYLPGALTLSLFPMVSANSANLKSSMPILLKAVLLNCILSGGGCLLLLLFPELIIKIFFGQKYLPAIPIVGFFGVAMFPMGLVSIFMTYFLALNKVKFIYPMIASFIVMICGINFYHNTLFDILTFILISGLISLVSFIIMLFVERYR